MEKVIDIEDRIPTLKEKRRRRTNKKFILLITLFFLTLFLLLYFQSPYSDIKAIEVQGSDLVEKEVYLKQSDLEIGQSMWSIREKEIEDKIQELEWVKNVDVNRHWLTTVEIRVEEWQKVAYIAMDNSYYPILENGVIFKEMSENAPIDAPIFLQFEDSSMRKRLLKELAELDSSVLALISQINSTPTSSDPYAITLFMNDGYEVRAEITTLSEKLNYYPSIVAQIESAGEFEKGIIDIEVGTYYRSYSEEYTIEETDTTSESDSSIDGEIPSATVEVDAGGQEVFANE
nr:FtsQ-type POTRA domain-containing protein [Lysinibacillus timonensis]